MTLRDLQSQTTCVGTASSSNPARRTNLATYGGAAPTPLADEILSPAPIDDVTIAQHESDQIILSPAPIDEGDLEGNGVKLRRFTLDSKIVENFKVSSGVFRMVIGSPEIAADARPGMFVNVRLDPRLHLLRRPLGVADVTGDTFTMFYRVVGNGTRILSSLSTGESLNVLGPLGNGFSTGAHRPLIVGGGMGLAPLLFLAKSFAGAADVLIGGRGEDEVFWTKFFEGAARKILITTDDGSFGVKGLVTSVLPSLFEKNSYDMVYACGPQIMMKKVSEMASEHGVPCQVSLERHMACGLGACLSCACDTKTQGRKKVCVDGPVFFGEEVFF